MHTLSVTKLCDYYIHNYPMINADLLITAAIFHDIGKVYELSPFPENDYTDAGQLLGSYYDRVHRSSVTRQEKDSELSCETGK